MELDDLLKMVSPEFISGPKHIEEAVVKMDYDHGKIAIKCKCTGTVTMAYVIGTMLASISKRMSVDEREVFKNAVKIAADLEEAIAADLEEAK